MEFSDEELQQIFKIFKDESEEHLGNINKYLLDLEKNPDDIDLLTALFREAHSIKGSARMLGVVSIQDLAHKIEDLLGLAKDKIIFVSPDVVDIICKGIDVIGKILNKLEYNKLDYTDDESKNLAEEIERFAKKLQNKDFSANEEEKIEEPNIVNEDTLKDTTDNSNVSYKNDTKNSMMAVSSDYEIVLHYLEQLSSKYQKNNAVEEIIPLIDELRNNQQNSEKQNILKLVRENLLIIKQLDTSPQSEIIKAIEQAIEAIFKPKEDYDFQLIIERQKILKQMLELTNDSHEILNTSSKVPNNIAQNDIIQKTSSTPNYNYDMGVFKTLRVDTQKLDKLESLVEELIVLKINNKQHLEKLNSMLADFQDLQKFFSIIQRKEQNFSKKMFYHVNNADNIYRKNTSLHIDKIQDKINNLTELLDIFQKKFLNYDIRLNFLTDSIENTVKSIRILPLSTIFHMFPRMVRDIARTQGKQADIIITGSETSADKTIIEEIKSPLMHIVRNAIDHGIEPPEERIKVGKNPTGKILLNSYHSGNTLTIEVIDDGQGLNLEQIKEKALKKNLITEEELRQLSNQQIMNLIFWPGFTTDESITEISGRGVGLDVVHTKISQLDGTVAIQSQDGNGFKIVIKIPITLATLKALLIRNNNQVFAISSSYLKSVMTIEDEDIFLKEGKPTIIYENKSVKLIQLSELLDFPINNIPTKKHNVIITSIEDTVLAIEVDDFIRTEEILQKKLNPPLTRVKNISGVASLSNGETCLILNMNDIVKSSLSYNELQKNTTILSIPEQKQVSPTVLIVDDSHTTVTLEKNILKNAGYKVITAINGEDALHKLSIHSINLLVTDIDMPVMNGIELVRNIRLKDKKLPIIILTALNDNQLKVEAENLKINDYILKPEFSEKLFLDKIASLLGYLV